MIRVCLALVGTDSAAPATRPRITQEHGKPPRSMPLVGVATLVRVGPILDTSRPQPRRSACRYPLRHLF